MLPPVMAPVVLAPIVDVIASTALMALALVWLTPVDGLMGCLAIAADSGSEVT